MEPSIQFTVEVESDGKLPFLDVLLQWDPDGSISTTVFRKATHMDRYLDFMSHHPLAHKIAVVKTLHSRAGAICSDVTAKDQETRHIRQALISNGYPKGVIQHHATPACKRPTDDQSQDPVVTLPYVRGIGSGYSETGEQVLPWHRSRCSLVCHHHMTTLYILLYTIPITMYINVHNEIFATVLHS